MARVSGKIRRVLVDAGLVTDRDWTAAREKGGNVLETLLTSDSITEGALLQALGRASGAAPVDLSRLTPDPAAVECLPQESCLEFGVLPLSKNGDCLTVCVSDPFDVLLLDDMRRRTGCDIQQVVSHPGSLKRALEKQFQTGARQVESLLGEVNAGNGELEVRTDEVAEDLEMATSGGGNAEDAPAVKLVNLILLKALKEKASDIHIEPGDKSLRVRYRVDGSLHQVMTPPKGILNAVISRLKIMSQLDIAERYQPQDGKFQIRYEGRAIDFRLSILPVVGGEKAVMRILDGGNLALKLETMGYEPQSLAHIRKAINAPYGMLLITGPTGSGKSTTLYSCVHEVAQPDINVVTVEDPVEYRMDGINQVPVNPKRNMTFAGALRSILRQDPDVILIGEIRDKETADIAVKAALTGHLVLSTLHTNDAPSTITRLMDMGIDPFMVSSSLLAIGAQRLARKVCEGCRQPLDLPEKELLAVGYLKHELPGIKLFQANPAGCARCSGGYKGRFAILETLYLDEKLKRMIVEGRSVHDLRAEAITQGMLTLRRVGLLNALRGRTSLEEVMRVTLDE
ncbi:MAG: Flp pilus assembly complex ATPase component TadA [Planctomycetes bacterium]|nr:Flp pilus assembly complex ATPase component TadA [Planctomycetota bacterium]